MGERTLTLRELVEEGLISRDDVAGARPRRPWSRQYVTDLCAGRAPVSKKVAAAIHAARSDVIEEVRLIGPEGAVRFVVRAQARAGERSEETAA